MTAARELLRSPRSWFWLAFVPIAGLRLLLFLATLGDPYLAFRVGDELEYHQWALAIAGGDLLRERPFFTTPLFAYYLGWIYFAAGHEVVLVRLANQLLGLASAYLVFRSAKLLYGPRIGALAMLLAGGCLAPLTYELFPEKTSLAYFFTALTLYLLTRSAAEEDRRAWFLAGASAGLAALAHALLQVLMPVAGLVVLWRAAGRLRLAWRPLALVALGFAAAIFPATLHNWIVARDFVPICYNGGQNFYASNAAENVAGTYFSPPFASANLKSEELDYTREAERRTGRAMKPSEVSNYWYARGWVDLRANPGLALKRYFWRLRWALNTEELPDARNVEFYRARYAPLRGPFWGFGGVALLGLVGCGLTLRDRRLLPFNALLLALSLAMSCFFVFGRYRLPLLVPLAILACAALLRFDDAVRRRQTRRLAAMAMLTAAAAWLVFVPLATPAKEAQGDFFVDYFNQGNRYLEVGRKDLALAEYRKALANSPRHHFANRAVEKIEQLERESQRAP